MALSRSMATDRRKPPKILLEGWPGIGKTTVARRVADELAAVGVTVAGFTTRELRKGRARVGFEVGALNGERAVLAHVERSGQPRVGKYGVDVEAFERIALPALAAPPADVVVVIDELGKMELASDAFQSAVLRVFNEPVAVLATVHVARHPFTDELRRRPDVETLRVTAANREGLPGQLVARLGTTRRG